MSTLYPCPSRPPAASAPRPSQPAAAVASNLCAATCARQRAANRRIVKCNALARRCAKQTARTRQVRALHDALAATAHYNAEVEQQKADGTRAGPGRIAATSAPGLGAPLPHLRRDWAHPCHIKRLASARCRLRGATSRAARTPPARARHARKREPAPFFAFCLLCGGSTVRHGATWASLGGGVKLARAARLNGRSTHMGYS